MNLSRLLAGLLAASSRPKKWGPLHPVAFAALQSSSLLSTETAAPTKRPYKRSPKPPVPEKPGFSQAARNPPPLLDPSKVPRPSEIPFQARVANSVHLVGTIGLPVQLEASPDGVYSAVSALVREKTKDFPQFWIPVMFQGDLAQIAACHLKEDDLVCISGQLSGDAPLLTVKDAQTNVQVLAHTLSFVENNSSKKGQIALDCSASVEENLSAQQLWNDLFSNPHKWWDNRTSKSNPSSAVFKHKDSGQLLWINESTPEWILSKLATLSFGQNSPKKSHKSGNAKDPENHSESLWSDLVANPQQWRDYRMNKLNGMVKPKYPDFKHKDTQKALWLYSAPQWVLSKLDSLEFSGSNDITKHEEDYIILSAQENGKDYISKNSCKFKGGEKAGVSNKNNENLWKDVLENPNKWWDNRSNKLNPKSPDFKHKDSGEGLWLNSSPPWVLAKLPPPIAEKKLDRQKATLLS